MRVVKWSPQERVDLPDLAATSFLAVGEFRRTIREALIGGDENRILRGFEVEASAVPDALVTVKLNDAGTLSVAVGAENLGNVTHGQLMGGVDDAARNEGNAQQTLDFTGQPNPATYTVQMRFVYADGASDNRAFWADATDSEFVSSADTRYLPGFELRLSGAASAEWIDLASVVWGGSTITAGNITDLRSFAMEGVTPYEQTTQAGAGGMPDFSRLATRGDTAVGINALWGVVRALGRQIQDIKGEDDSGNWNWWGRVFRPPGSATPVATGITRTMRSMELVSFTIGNGTETFGDFNGTSGLNTCLAHIAANEASLPQRIRIVIREGNTAITHTVTTGVVLTNKHLEIIGAEGGQGARGRTLVDPSTISTGNTFLGVTGANSGLTVRNLSNVGFELTNDAYLLGNFSGEAGPTLIENCELVGNLSAGGTRETVNVPGNGLRFVNSIVHGRVSIKGPASAFDLESGEVLSCDFRDCSLLLTDGAGNNPSKLAVRNCQFAAPATAYTAGNFDFSLVWCAASQPLTFENCVFTNHGDRNGLHIGTGQAENVVVRNCRFSTLSGATHAPGTSVFGSDGIGWQIWCAATSDTIANSNGNCVIDNCWFAGPADGSKDAGAIRMAGLRSGAIRDCRFEGINANATALSRGYGIKVEGAAAGGDGVIRIVGCRTEALGTTGTKDIRAIEINEMHNVVIEGCYLDGRDIAGAPIAALATSAGALRVVGSDNLKVSGCHFRSWDTAAARCIVFTSTSTRAQIIGNTFTDNAGTAILLFPAASLLHTNISSNSFFATGGGFAGVGVSAASFNGNVCDNFFDLAAGADCISLGAATNVVVVGNNCNGGNIQHTTGTPGPVANVRGYDETGGAGGQELNLNAVYT